MADENELEIEHMYIQIIRTPEDTETVQELIRTYVHDVLNHTVTFYKAQVNASKDGDSTLFRIKFFLFSSDRRYWNNGIQENLKKTFLQTFLKKIDGFLDSERTETLIHEEKRTPHYLYPENSSEKEEYVNWDNVPGKNDIQKFLNWWMIVPSVQWDFFNLHYQMYTFDITHQTFVPKLIHFFSIPTNALLFMSFLAQFEFGLGHAAFSVNASLICLLVLSLLYLVMGFKSQSWLLGFVATIVLCVCWMTGNMWYHAYKTPGNPWYNPTNVGTNPILWSYINSVIQASSHLAVPQLPPNITGVHHWESLHVFLFRQAKDPANKRRNTFFVIMAFVCFPILSVGVAWFSRPHLIGTEVMYIMAGIGYKPQDFEKYKRVVEKAELSGDPYLDHYPTDANHLMNDDAKPFISRLVSKGLIRRDASHNEVVKCMTNLMLCKRYFSHGMRERRLEDMQHMLAKRKH